MADRKDTTPRQTETQRQTARLVELGREHFTLHAHPVTAAPYAVAVTGSSTRRPFHGQGNVRPALAKVFCDVEGRVPSTAALSSAMGLLAEEARGNGADPADEILAAAGGHLVEDDARPSAATQLVELALDGYELGVTPDGETFAVSKTGPKIVRQLRGGRQSLRSELAARYFEKTGSAAAQAALADACSVLEGHAQRLDPNELHLRVAQVGDALVIDLGDPTGQAIVITARGWQVVDEAPTLFRRTGLTGALPTPERGFTFDTAFWPLLNIAERYRPVLAAALTAALFPGIPHPVLNLSGEQGTAKSTATKAISALIDPSPAQLRKAPKDADAWVTAAAGSWVVALDNLGAISESLSDSLCRASTGDGDVRRRLYSDGDLHVLAFRRFVIMNGIDIGGVQDDLADRLVTLPLERIPDSARKLDEQVATDWAEQHPRALGALLDLAVDVLARLPTVKLTEKPRMADFARILAAVDEVQKTHGLRTYLAARTELAEDAVSSDPVLGALVAAVTDECTCTAAQLLEKIKPADEKWRAPKGWPAKARDMTTVLKRRAPSLRRLGWVVEQAEQRDTVSRAVLWHLVPVRRPADDARNARNARGGQESAAQATSGGSSDSRATPSVSSDTQPTLDAGRSNDTGSLDDRSTPDNAVNSPNRVSSSVSSETSVTAEPSHIFDDPDADEYLAAVLADAATTDFDDLDDNLHDSEETT